MRCDHSHQNESHSLSAPAEMPQGPRPPATPRWKGLLTALKSAVDILSRGELTDAQRRFAAIAQRNADQMVLLVERLLERTMAKP